MLAQLKKNIINTLVSNKFCKMKTLLCYVVLNSFLSSMQLQNLHPLRFSLMSNLIFSCLACALISLCHKEVYKVFKYPDLHL